MQAATAPPAEHHPLPSFERKVLDSQGRPATSSDLSAARSLVSSSTSAPELAASLIWFEPRELAGRVAIALGAEPVEDGYDHPLQEILLDATKRFSSISASLIEQVYAALSQRPSALAGYVQLVGRLPQRNLGTAATNIVISALNHKSPAVREAAVSCVDQWQDRELAPLLRDHRDSVAWIQEYAEQVASQLA